MKTKHALAFSLLLVILIVFPLALSVQASPAAQTTFSTPTPGPDGRILYTVQEGETCLAIELKTGVTVQTLLQLNPLDENCTLVAGQELLLGIGGPAAYTPTPGPAPSATPIPPSPTPFTGTTEVCVMLFNDENGDGLRQETELGLDGGAVSLININGSYSQTQDTVSALDLDGEPVLSCFNEVPEGEYNVSMAIPDGYNPTLNLTYELSVQAGDRARVNFGAQSKTATAAEVEEQNSGSSGGSSWLGILGVLLLLAAGGLGAFAWRMNKPESKLSSRSGKF
ncbi:MAG: LysM peptidoglycan-binding domain-containing protein [Anaerolineales bacterium]|nr:LysM peptidoglycan-binding domain-containing protein [Anaerolineales bacterium]